MQFRLLMILLVGLLAGCVPNNGTASNRALTNEDEQQYDWDEMIGRQFDDYVPKLPAVSEKRSEGSTTIYVFEIGDVYNDDGSNATRELVVSGGIIVEVKYLQYLD